MDEGQGQGQAKQRSRQPASAAARVGLFDTETGEMLDKGRLIYVPPKMRIKGFFMANQMGFEKLAKSGLTCEGFRVLMFMLSRMDYENAISISQKEIGEALGMHKQNVSRAVKALRTAGVFDVEAAHVVYLATDLGWKGKVRNLHQREKEVSDEHWKREAQAAGEAMDARIDALPTLCADAASV